MRPRSRLFSPNHKPLWVRCLVDASEPDLMVAIGLKASWPVSSGRDEDHVTAVRRDSRGIGKLTVALDAGVTVHGQQVRCWDATSRRIRACHPNVDCTGAIGIGQEIVCDGNRSEEHTSELQSRLHLVCRLLLEKKKQRSAYRYLSTHH